MNRPKDLGIAGRQTWTVICNDFDVAGNEPLVAELARCADRLAEIRRAMVGADSRELVALTNTECRVSASFVRIWKAMGLSTAEIPVRGAAKNAKK